jgi:hypothetical protein
MRITGKPCGDTLGTELRNEGGFAEAKALGMERRGQD